MAERKHIEMSIRTRELNADHRTQRWIGFGDDAMARIIGGMVVVGCDRDLETFGEQGDDAFMDASVAVTREVLGVEVKVGSDPISGVDFVPQYGAIALLLVRAKCEFLDVDRPFQAAGGGHCVETGDHRNATCSAWGRDHMGSNGEPSRIGRGVKGGGWRAVWGGKGQSSWDREPRGVDDLKI